MGINKFLITQSLLSSWEWAFKKEDGKEEFINVLERKPVSPNPAMLNGQKFENLVNEYCKGAELDKENPWAKGVEQVGNIVKGGALQVALSKDIRINGIDFVLYGVLDYLKCGVISDCKFSQTYKNNKYLSSPQHPMYFEICPGAFKFQYLVSDGEYMWKEEYRREDAPSITKEIETFMNYLDRHSLIDLYCKNWQSKY